MESTFRDFLYSESRSLEDVSKTLAKIPSKHKALVDGYSYEFQTGSTLKNDKHHVGVIDEKNKKITIASPWNHARDFVLLHEVAHMVWREFVDKDKKKKWSDLVHKTKEKMKETDEELFCHAYAATYCNTPPEIHNHPEWNRFIKNI